jgi:predicted RNA binding protein YcfA (HicA-like mRNA interferase family)
LDRRELVRHLEDHGCEFVREGGNHTIYRNPATGRIRSILRYCEVKNTTAREICKGLGIGPP